MPAPPDTTPPRFPDEAERNDLAAELECYLNSLLARCDELEAAPALSAADQLLLDQLNGLLGALYHYDQATDHLLASYRQALASTEQSAPVPSLEVALGLPEAGEAAPAWTRNPHPTPAELLTEREADPVYRLGWVRGHRQGVAETERQYQRLTSLYAQYAILVPPPTYQPSPLAARLTARLDKLLMRGPTLPPATRRLLLTQTITTPPASHAA